ncbi:related to GAS1 - glycophospholipid-anchored surface glycoprotein [Ustilago sp. UG-2017a]|nr:related to GAS1 - glycophospholipid-anchored surface glycoprotein [Ustilago sp. UG-2017a]
MRPQASSKWSDDPMKDGSQSSDDPRTERAMIHIRLPVRQGDTAHLLTLPIPFSRLVQQGLTAHTQHPADGLKPRLKDPQLGTPSSQCGEQRDCSNRFYIKGIAYQEPAPIATSTAANEENGGFPEPDSFTDPLALPDACTRDVANLRDLGINTVRVYSIHSSLNHDSCMSTFSNAGIYVILDLALPLNGSINRAQPSWDTGLLHLYAKTIDVFTSTTDGPNGREQWSILNTASFNSPNIIGTLTGQACSCLGQRGGSCAPILADGATGTYGNYSFCSSGQRVQWAMLLRQSMLHLVAV